MLNRAIFAAATVQRQEAGVRLANRRMIEQAAQEQLALAAGERVQVGRGGRHLTRQQGRLTIAVEHARSGVDHGHFVAALPQRADHLRRGGESDGTFGGRTTSEDGDFH